MIKLSPLIVAVAIVSCVSVLVALAVSNIPDYYSVDTTSESIDDLNNMQKLSTDMETLQKNLSEISQPTGFLDKVGAYFAAGYTATRATFSTINHTKTIASKSIDNMPLDGDTTTTIRNTVIIVVVILFVVSIILGIILKTDKT